MTEQSLPFTLTELHKLIAQDMNLMVTKFNENMKSLSRAVSEDLAKIPSHEMFNYNTWNNWY